MLAILMLLGVSAIKISNTQSIIVKNRQQAVQDLYDAEAGINYALANSDLWLPDLFGNTTSGDSYKSIDYLIESDKKVAIEIREITEPKVVFGDLSSWANDLPIQKHVSAPPPGAGFGMKNFEVRRYGITSGTYKGNTKIQVGVWKIFNKE